MVVEKSIWGTHDLLVRHLLHLGDDCYNPSRTATVTAAKGWSPSPTKVFNESSWYGGQKKVHLLVVGRGRLVVELHSIELDPSWRLSVTFPA